MSALSVAQALSNLFQRQSFRVHGDVKLRLTKGEQMFTVTTSQVAIGALIVNSLVALALFKSSNLQSLRRSKSEIYQRTIFAAESLREAYFEGEPRVYPNVAPQVSPDNWEWTELGWTRPDDWSENLPYIKATMELDAALAGLVLVARKELAKAAFNLEAIAIDYRKSEDRAEKMNKIIRLMKKELKTVKSRDIKISLEWD